MTIIGELALILWPIFNLFIFNRRNPAKSIMVNYFGAWLFLPEMAISLPFLPDLDKYVASSLSVLLCILLFDQRALKVLKIRKFDYPVIFLSIIPIFTSVSNDLGIWDGFSSTINTIFMWGVPYFAGRIYFNTVDSLRYIMLGIGIAGALYIPFVWFELVMSPNLHRMIYGFNQGDWLENVRYGGWRPKVFMQHGLMVSFFLTASTIAMFLIAETELKRKIRWGYPKLTAWFLAFSVVMCKSGNGIVMLIIGLSTRLFLRGRLVQYILVILLFTAPVYLSARTMFGWDGSSLVDLISEVSDAQRAGSIRIRMVQENLFAQRAAERWVFGWGGWGRAFPVDEYGNRLTRGVDSLWIIKYSENGITGLISMYLTLLLGPYLILKKISKSRFRFSEQDRNTMYLTLLIPVLFSIDSLANAMLSPIYILISGGLIAVYVNREAVLIAETSEPSEPSEPEAVI